MYKLLPLWARILIPLAILALAVFLWHRVIEHWREQGREEVRAEWTASVERGKAEVERLKAEANKITTVTEIKYVDRIKEVKVKGDTIIQYREVFVPADSGYLNGGFRVYFDAAVTNRVPSPAEIANAAPVAVTDVADTHAANAKQCNVYIEQLNGWIDWAEQQCKLNDKGCRYDGGQ